MKKNKRYYWLGKETPSSQDTFFLDALDSDLWVQGNKDNWDTCWQTDMPEKIVFEQLGVHKTINHILGNNALTIKSDLYTTLAAAKDRLDGTSQAERYDFFPDTFSMPEDYFRFQQVAAANPNWQWIQKPKNLSRGRGIEIVKHPTAIPLGEEWLIQRYIEDPHLYKGHKYVLRCYALITSIEPLRCYWYNEGSMKLASDKYDYDNFDNPYSYLTNPDINEENSGAEVPVTFIPFKDYREWLCEEGIDDANLFERLENIIGLSLIAGREAMRGQNQTISADTQGCYELIGFDCMIDSDLKPWVIECNLSPSLDICTETYGGKESETITKKALVQDVVNIMGLNNDYSASQLSYRERVVAELKSAGNFSCIFPTQKAVNYLNCFPIPRYADIASLPENIAIDDAELQLTIENGSHIVFDDSLLLISQNGNKNPHDLIVPNEVATWIGLKITEGISPLAIINELTTLLPKIDSMSDDERYNTLSIQVWDMLADWSYAGLFVSQKGDLQADVSLSKKSYLILANVTLSLRYIGSEIDAYLSHYLINEDDYKQAKKSSSEMYNVDIITSSKGYLLTHNASVIAEHCKLSAILPSLIRVIIEKHLSRNKENIVAFRGTIATFKNKKIMLLGDETTVADSYGHFLNQQTDTDVMSGVTLLSIVENKHKNECVVSTVDMPIRLPLRDYFDCYKGESKKTWLLTEEKSCQFWLPLHHKTSTEKSVNNVIKAAGKITTDIAAEIAAKIDAVFIINVASCNSSNDIQALSKAQALSELSRHCIFNTISAYDKAENIAFLASWVRDIPIACVSINDNNECPSQKKELENTFKAYVDQL